jgi:hypothetical protein
MITSFLPVLATHSLTLIINGTAEDVTVTAMLKPKSDKDREHSLQVSGPLSEVESVLAPTIQQAVIKIAGLSTSMADLDAQIAEARKAKEALLKAEKDAVAAKIKKPAPVATKKDDEAEEPVIKNVLPRAAPKAAPAQPSTTSGSLSTAGLVPATFDLGI